MGTDLASIDSDLHRFEAWHQITCRDYSFTQYRGDLPETFEGRYTSQHHGSFVLAENCLFSEATIDLQRRDIDIRRDQVDDFVIISVEQGEVSFAQGEQSFSTRGGFFLYDQTRPFRFNIEGCHHLSAITISRAALGLTMPAAPRFAGRLITGTTALEGLAGAMLHHLFACSREADPTLVGRLGLSALDMIGMALDPNRVAQDASIPKGRALLKKVKSHLAARIQEPHTLESVARDLSVSPRTLSRLFASEGTTPMRWLWQQRLERANMELRADRFASITEVAFRCGFNSASHFSRLFRNAFGHPPTSTRAE